MKIYAVHYPYLTDSQKRNVQRMWPKQDPEKFYYHVDGDGRVVMCFPVTFSL